jgi:hypothetical protein
VGEMVGVRVPTVEEEAAPGRWSIRVHPYGLGGLAKPCSRAIGSVQPVNKQESQEQKSLGISPGWIILAVATVAATASLVMRVPKPPPGYAVGSGGMLIVERAGILFLGGLIVVGLAVEAFGYDWPVSLSFKWKNLEIVAQGTRQTAKNAADVAGRLDTALATIETLQTGMSGIRAELGTIPQLRKDLADVGAQVKVADDNLVALARAVRDIQTLTERDR